MSSNPVAEVLHRMLRAHAFWVAALVLPACVLITLTGPKPIEARTRDGLPTVAVKPIDRSTRAHVVTAYGTLSPSRALSLSPEIAGKVVWVSEHLRAGAQLAAGEPLLRLDERDFLIDAAIAEARFAQAEAGIELEAGQGEFALREWQSWQRTSGDSGPASALALRLPQQADAEAQVRLIGAELDRARLQLERTRIEAPWPAIVVDASAVEGQLLVPGSVAATLYPTDHGVVELQLPLHVTQRIEQGIERVELRPAGAPAALPTIGVIEGVVRSLTADTRLATVRVRVENPMERAGWAFGMHLEARIVTATDRPVAHIPAELVVGGNLAWIHREGRARQQVLRPVEVLGDLVLVEDAFDSEDALIVDRPIGLFDGAAVALAAPGSTP